MLSFVNFLGLSSLFCCMSLTKKYNVNDDKCKRTFTFCGMCVKTLHYKNDILVSEDNYNGEKIHGKLIYYYCNGNKKYDYSFMFGEKNGTCTHYTEYGKKRFEFIYKKDYNYLTTKYYDDGVNMKSQKIYKIPKDKKDRGYHIEKYDESIQMKNSNNFSFNSSIKGYIENYEKMEHEDRDESFTIIRYYKKNAIKTKNIVDKYVIKYIVSYHKNGYVKRNGKNYYKNKKFFFY